jgi:uncharacterized protein (TIGR02996 family)
MNTGDALLADILANPEDDGPRLVYADWLDEHAQPERAEFIRLQVEYASLDEDDPRRQALERRSVQVIQDFNVRPRPEWAKGIDAIAAEWRYRRGFVEEVTLPAATFLERAADLFRVAPVRSVHFTGITPESLTALGACPFLARLTGIDLRWNEIRDQGVTTLLHAPHLGELRSLCLNSTGVTEAGVEALAASARLTHLNVLDLGTYGRGFTPNQVGTQGAEALAGSPHLRQLTSLILGAPPEYYGGNAIGTAGCLALAGSAILDSVHTLDLSTNGIEDAGARALAESPHAARLTTLDLRGNALTAEGVEALITSPVLSHLRVLGLSSNPGGPACEYYYDWDGTCVHGTFDNEAAARLARRFPREVRIE